MKIEVQQLIVPIGSSIGFVIGVPTDDGTKVVVAAGDQRVLVAIGEAMAANPDAQVVVDVPTWAILRILEMPRE